MLLAATPAFAQMTPDWINHATYAAANAEAIKAEKHPVAVFMGNSITDIWAQRRPEFFAANNYVGRGVSGQVTTQMLGRFRSDVVDLKPEVVVILAGINDIARNNGEIELKHIVDNIASMTDIARWHGIKPIVCSVLPAACIDWRPEVPDTPGQVVALNKLLKKYCEDNNIMYVDYYSPMVVEGGALNPNYGFDYVHPSNEGYEVMEPIIVKAVNQALNY